MVASVSGGSPLAPSVLCDDVGAEQQPHALDVAAAHAVVQHRRRRRRRWRRRAPPRISRQAIVANDPRAAAAINGVAPSALRTSIYVASAAVDCTGTDDADDNVDVDADDDDDVPNGKRR